MIYFSELFEKKYWLDMGVSIFIYNTYFYCQKILCLVLLIKTEFIKDWSSETEVNFKGK